MNFPPTAAMYLFDLCLIAASAIATIVVVSQWPKLKEMQARMSAIMVLAGIWMQSSVYAADLYSMTLLKYLKGVKVSDKYMMNAHTYYAWYASVLSTIFITTGLFLYTRKFVNYTERLDQLTQELSVTRQRLDAALTGANIGIFDINIQKGKSVVSSTWKSLMGFGPGEEFDAQAEWTARVHPEDLPRVQMADADCIAGKTARSEIEYRIQVADGTWRWMKSVATPHNFSRKNIAERLVGVQLDITELKENELIKREFVSNVSHELRTPLSSIHSALRLIIGKFSNDLPDDAVHFLNIAQRNSNRLLLLVNDILDIEEMTSQKGLNYNISEAKIGDIVQSSIESIQILSEAADTKIEFCNFSQDISGFIDTDRFEQILVNLISNAIKFSPKDGLVQVKLENDGGSTRVSVTDQGPGIPSDFSGKIFERFSKADGSNSRDAQGAGLGLYISKQLAEGMGGQIGFQSEPNVATCFWVSFPTDLRKPLAAGTDVAA